MNLFLIINNIYDHVNEVIILKVDIHRVYSENEEHAEIHTMIITEEINHAVDLLENNKKSIPVTDEETTLFCPLTKIYYFDSVDNHTFVYTKDRCFETKYRLYELESMLPYDFFRCSKSMIINIRKIESVKAEINARMRAVMLNGEAVIISRSYVKDLKGRLGI